MKRKVEALFAAAFFALTLSLSMMAQAPAATPSGSAPDASKTTQIKTDVPKIDAAIGPCSADFTVTDASGKPVFNAQIHVLIRYRAFGIGKVDLTVGTNSDGLAEVVGLPDVNKRPVHFDVSKDGVHSTVEFDPGNDCHPKYRIQLK